MAEYIDRGDLTIWLNKKSCEFSMNDVAPIGWTLCGLVNELATFPSADVVERKILPEDSEALVTALRNCGYPGDVHYCRDCVFANDGGTCHRKKLLPAAADAIEELTDRNVGKWLFWQDDPDANVYECSACHEPLTLNEGTPKENNFNYCPFCGLPMIGGDDNV